MEQFVTHIDGQPGPISFNARSAASHARTALQKGHQADIRNPDGTLNERAMAILASPRKARNGAVQTYELHNALALLSNVASVLAKTSLRVEPTAEDKTSLEDAVNAVYELL